MTDIPSTTLRRLGAAAGPPATGWDAGSAGSACPYATHSHVIMKEVEFPKHFSKVTNSVTWRGRGSAGATVYRTSSGQDEGAALPVPFRRPRLCMGAVVPGATYTVWTAGAPRNGGVRNQKRHYVWWARLEALPAVTLKLATRLAAEAHLPHPEKVAPVIVEVHRAHKRIEFPDPGDPCGDRGDLTAATRTMKALVRRLGATTAYALDLAHPFWRAWACPLLFRLWPQSALYALNWPAFVKLAELVTAATHPTPFMFRWCLSSEFQGPLPTLDLTTVLGWTAVRGPGAPWAWPDAVAASAQPHLLALLHVLQRTFAQSVHTYLTPAQVVEVYYDRLSSARLAHGLAEALQAGGTGAPDVLTPRSLQTWLCDTPGLLEAATTLGVTVEAQRPAIEKKRTYSRAVRKYLYKEHWGTTPVRVLYSRHMYETEAEVVQLLNAMIARFNRAVHADGCESEADVRARIASAQPPAHDVTEGAPSWDSAAFQAKWAQLDPTQQRAVARAVLLPLTIVDGRPGYGKTQVGEAVAALFPSDEGLCVPLATYGRIAALLKKRLGDGWTFHKAAALARARSTPKVIKRMLTQAPTSVWDELSLQTLQHALLALTQMKRLVRLVLLGDEQQMPGIGAGTIVGSLLVRYRGTAAYTRLLHPHRFLPHDGEALKVGAAGLTQRPASPYEGAAVVWNMQELERFHAAPDTYKPDLLYGTTWDDIDRGARFVILDERGSWEERLKPVAKYYFDGEADVMRAPKIGEMPTRAHALPTISPLQMLAHRRDFGNRLTRILRGLVYPREKARDAHLYVGESITFSKNAYFTRTGQARGDTEAAYREDVLPSALQMAEEDDEDGEDASTEAADEADEAPATPLVDTRHLERPTELSDRSFNVMNGQVRRIVAIIDVAPKPSVAVSTEYTEDRRPAKRARVTAADAPTPTSPPTVATVTCVGRQKRTGDRLAPLAKKRLLVFSDSTQLNVTEDYDMKNVQPAAITTVNKAQGDERDHVHFLHELFDKSSGGSQPSVHVTREMLHTAHTRAQETFVWHGSLAEFLNVHRNMAPMRQERFAFELVYSPDQFS